MRGVELKDLPVTVNRNLDLLFLIDDSAGGGDYQVSLATGFPRFLDVLDTIPGGLPNVHIGVTTSDMGSKGAQDTAPGPGIGSIGSGGCSGFGKNGDLQLFGAPITSSDRFISDVLDPAKNDGSRIRNYNYVDGTSLSTVFSQMARAGFGGCGFEQHLEAVKQALSPDHVANAGFLRADAYLAVVIVGDEDDCSMSHSSLISTSELPLGPLQSFRCTRYGVTCDQGGTNIMEMNQVGTKSRCHPSADTSYLTDVAAYADFLKSLKTDPNDVVVAGIVGTPDPFAVELRVAPGQTTEIPALAHSCSYTGAAGLEVADPAVRIKFFLDQFPNRSSFVSVCQEDLSGGLQQIGELVKALIVGDPCIEGTLVDVDSKAPGLQYDCDVSAVTGRGTPAQSEQILPRCTPEDSGATNQPCWHIANDPASCPNSGHLSLKIEGMATLPGDAHVLANCSIDAGPLS